MKRWIIFCLVLFLVISLTACGEEQSVLPNGTKPLTCSLEVKKIDGLSEDFVTGVDISMLPSLMNAGRKFYDFDGNEVETPLVYFKECGINTVQIRIFNAPYDEDLRSYGGGNCTLEQGLMLAKQASQYGLNVSLHLMYSDFWVTLEEQNPPKEWKNLSFDLKKKAVTDWSILVMKEFRKIDVVPTYVFLGGELQYGFAGETSEYNALALLKVASKAIRGVSISTGIGITYGDINEMNCIEFANKLQKNDVSYDVFALSYEPEKDAAIDAYESTLRILARDFEKEVMISDCSWAHTLLDYDGEGNYITASTEMLPYECSDQGQADMIRDIAKMLHAVGDLGRGMIYEDACWIIPPFNDKKEKIVAWEGKGCGYLATYVFEYGNYLVGLDRPVGCKCENEALFDKDGHPLESLKAFGALWTGSH